MVKNDGTPPGGPDPKPPPGRGHLFLEGAFHALSSTALVNRFLGEAIRRRRRIGFTPLPLDKEETGPSRAAALSCTGPAAGCVYAWHQWPPRAEHPDGIPWVVYQGWEYGSLPADLAALLRDGPDEVWTYSTHCARNFTEDGIPAGKVYVVPLGVDPRCFHPRGPVHPSLAPFVKEGYAVFLFVGGTLFRKGVDLLLSAYCEAFRRSDRVVLVLKEMGSDSFYKGYNLSEAAHRLAGHPRAPRILIIAERLGETEMAALYRSGTCLVHPYRGEGFGLPVLEALASGVPVVVPRGGACDDFLPEEGVFPIPAARRTLSLPYPTVRTPWVLEPDRAALVHALRAVARDPGAPRAAARRAAGSIGARWTWDRTAARVEERCRALADSQGACTSL